MDKGLGERLFKFSIEVIKLLSEIKSSTEISIIKYQLAKASTSSCANFEEAQSASSKADFKYKMDISLREMRESNYWLRIIKELELCNTKSTINLVNESEELKKILGSICSKIKNKNF